MSTKRRRFDDAFKRKVLDEVAAGKSIAAATRQYGLSKNSVYEWRDATAAETAAVSIPRRELSELQLKVAQLERMVGHLTLENDILKKLERLREPKEGERL